MRVILTGFMGTGKTAVGRRLAARLGRELVDTDALIERATGRTVREIFAQDGEARFRELERAAVAEACAAGDVVISTGGGTLVDERNFRALSDAGLLVCLTATPRAIARRVRATVAERPLLHGHPSLTGRIRELLAARAATYERIPLQIDTSGLGIEEVVDAIVGHLAAAETAAQGRAPAARRAPACGGS